ncbi:MAG: hypothetical protein NT102_05195 [Caldiserica bacterium]|nr:hypothetical protein [Caldisericota bacterium]
MTTDRTEMRLLAGALAAPHHLEKLQKLGMSSSLFEDGDLRLSSTHFSGTAPTIRARGAR